MRNVLFCSVVFFVAINFLTRYLCTALINVGIELPAVRTEPANGKAFGRETASGMNARKVVGGEFSRRGRAVGG